MNLKLNKLSKSVILAHVNGYFKPYNLYHQKKSFDKSVHNQLIAGLSDLHVQADFPTYNEEISKYRYEYNGIYSGCNLYGQTIVKNYAGLTKNLYDDFLQDGDNDYVYYDKFKEVKYFYNKVTNQDKSESVEINFFNSMESELKNLKSDITLNGVIAHALKNYIPKLTHHRKTNDLVFNFNKRQYVDIITYDANPPVLIKAVYRSPDDYFEYKFEPNSLETTNFNRWLLNNGKLDVIYRNVHFFEIYDKALFGQVNSKVLCKNTFPIEGTCIIMSPHSLWRCGSTNERIEKNIKIITNNFYLVNQTTHIHTNLLKSNDIKQHLDMLIHKFKMLDDFFKKFDVE